MQYLYSVYWALTTLTTVGYGDIIPANNAERAYALLALLIGALVFGFLLSSIGDMISKVGDRVHLTPLHSTPTQPLPTAQSSTG